LTPDPWRIQFGMSALDPQSARRATLRLVWTIPLERNKNR
jgi:hypothetical protein